MQITEQQAMSRFRPSVCPLDCPDTCSLTVEVADDRVVAVKGSKANPYTAGVLCAKVAKGYPEFVHGPNRVRYPLRRNGKKGAGEFERISGHQAVEHVHARLSEVVARAGAEAIVPLNYAGPHGLLGGGSMDKRFFHRLGATQLDGGPLCGGVKDLAYRSVFGAVPGTTPDQVTAAALIVVWSNNVTVSNLHLAREIKQARECGGRLVVIDPKRIRIAEQADLHLPIRPGTDAVLAMALAGELERIGGVDRDFVQRWVLGFDDYMKRAREYSLEDAARICGVNVADIRRFADWYHRLSPAAISIGNGLERTRNGGNGIRAILALPALAGKFGVVGGGIVAKAGNAFPKTPARLQRPDLAPAGTRRLNILDVPEHILRRDLAPPIEALFIYNHNPVAVHPDQNRMRRALASEDLFVVGCDVAMTDSLKYADIVLPAATHFEHDDLFAAYGQHYLQRAQAVIPPVAESLPNTEIFRRLAAAFDFEQEIFQVSDSHLMDEAVDAEDDRMGGASASRLPLDRALPMCFENAAPVMFENVFPATPSGKVELFSADLERTCGQGLPGFEPLDDRPDLCLITPSSNKRTNATFGGLSFSDGLECLEIHPHDAEARGLADGCIVKVWNELGAVHLRLQVSTAVRRGVVYSPKGAWLRTSPTGQTVNALIADSRTDIGQGACYNDTWVEVCGAN